MWNFRKGRRGDAEDKLPDYASSPNLARRAARHLRHTFVAGIFLIVPIALAYLVLRLVFDTLDGIVRPGVEQLFGRSLPGVGILFEIILIYLAGLIFANVLGRRAVRWIQGGLLRVPVIGFVYGASKQLIESFSGTGPTGFKRVVMLEYPRVGTWTIGFLTSIISGDKGQELAVVYIPTAPTPNSGWVAIVPLEEVYDTNLSVQQAFRLVLSGGIISPEAIKIQRIGASGLAATPGMRS